MRLCVLTSCNSWMINGKGKFTEDRTNRSVATDSLDLGNLPALLVRCRILLYPTNVTLVLNQDLRL